MRNLYNVIYFLICWFCFSANESIAQIRTLHEGDNITIGDSATMTISGNFKDSSQVLNNSVENLGQIYLNGDMINEGANRVFGYDSSLVRFGMVNFFGSTSHTVQGLDKINFCNLQINLPSNNLVINKKIQINDSLYFITGNLFLSGDTLVLNYLNSPSTSTASGIINETNTNRIYGPDYPIVVQNIAWNNPGTFSFIELKGLGINFVSNDALGASVPILYRYNLSQQCGPQQGSVERTYRFSNITTAGTFSNVTARYHDPLERSMFTDGDSMNIYVSTDNFDTWRDINGTDAFGIVSNSPYTKTISNLTAYTITKDSCDSIPDVFIHQILNLSDTIFNIDSALFCDPLNPSARLVAAGSIGEYVWVTPSDTITVTNNVELIATEIGTYTLICTNARGCINKKQIVLVAASPAESAFSAPVSACDLSALSFSPTTVVSGTNYVWDFGDFTTDSTTFASAGTTHTYPTSGNYTVTLTATTSIGCVSQSTNNVVVNPIPVPDFVAGSACVNSPATFTNQTTISINNPVTLNWDFTSDNIVDTTTAQNVSGGDVTNTYSTAGTYTVTLTASSLGCSSGPVSYNVVVYNLPTPNFTVASACLGTPVVFTNTTDTLGLSPTTFLWDFNTSLSGNTSTFENPSYLYPSAGTYNVSLQATTNQGCVYTLDSTVTVDENPVSIFTLTDTCENTLSAFLDFSTISGVSTITGWTWDFGDGNSSTLQNVSYSYLADGIYTVTHTVTTTQGCTSTSTQPITIFNGPSVGFSALDQCVGVPANIFNTSSNAVSYGWSIPSILLTSTNINETQTFMTAGYHPISLTATSVNGCTNTVVDSIRIRPLPIDVFGDTTRTCGSTLVLDANDNSVNAGASFAWNTGSTTSGISVTITGDYSVDITTIYGCTITDDTYALLNVPVAPNLGSDGPSCDSLVLDAGYYGSGTSYNWSASNPTSLATTQNISVLVDGQYIVQILDQNGCIGADTVNITIVPSTPVSLGGQQINSCEGTTVTLDAVIGGTYLWSDGSTLSTLDVTTPGFYGVEVVAGGCSSGDTIEVVFDANPIFSLGSDSQDCDSKILNVFTPGSTYIWNDLTTAASNVVTTTGTYWVDVTLTSTGCVVRDSIDVVINPLPIVTLPNDTNICSYQSITLDAQNIGSSFVWNNGSVNQLINVSVTGNYTVQVVDVNGCTSSGSINVNVLPLFAIDLGQDLPFCEGAEIILELDTVYPGATYNWYNNTGTLSSSDTYSVQDTGFYYLQIIDQYECVAMDSLEILPSSLSLFAVFLMDSKIESCDTVQFINLSYPQPFTSSWDFGDGSLPVTDSMPSKQFCLPFGTDSAFYDVKLTLSNGVCISTQTKTLEVRGATKIQILEESFAEIFTEILETIVYPNPNNGDFTLRIKLENEAPIQVDIFDLLGKQIIAPDKFVAKEINRSYSLPKTLPGMYIVRVKVGREQKTVKYIKIHK